MAKKVIITDDVFNMLSAAPGNMTRRLFERYVERLAKAEADMIAVDMAIPDLCYYETKVGDWWGQFAEEYPQEFWNVFHNIRNLIEGGDDPGGLGVIPAVRPGQNPWGGEGKQGREEEEAKLDHGCFHKSRLWRRRGGGRGGGGGVIGRQVRRPCRSEA